MINVSGLVSDPDFAQNFTVLRAHGGRFIAGVWTEGTAIGVKTKGVIYPSTEEEISQVPEADRVTGMVTFITKIRMYATHITTPSGDKGISDKVVWKENTYKIVTVMPYGDFGFFLAVGVRLSGA